MISKRLMLFMAIGSLLALGLITGCTSLNGWGGTGPSMMGGGWGSNSGSGTPLTMDQALGIAQEYMGSYNNPDLRLSEIMEFDNQFYVAVEEASTGMHAFEMLVEQHSGRVHPEPGPNMMWNMKYGQMMGDGHHMDSAFRQGESFNGPMTVSPTQARELAQQYVNTAMPGMVVDQDADAFYGYYTMHILRDGQIIGMLSVNGYTGQVWHHSWHGRFIGMRTLSGHGPEGHS